MKPQQREKSRSNYKSQMKRFIMGIALVDAFSLAVAFGLAYVIRFEARIPVFYQNVDSRISFYLILSLALIPLWLIIFWLYQLYDENILLGGLKEYIQLFNACVSGAVIIAVIQFLSEELIIARGWVGLAWVLTFLMTLVGRFLIRRVGYSLRKKGLLNRPTIILGANSEGKILGEQLAHWPTSGLTVIGYLDNEQPIGTEITSGIVVLDRIQNLDQHVYKEGIQELVITSSALSREDTFDIFKKYGASEDVQIRMSSGLFDLLTTGLYVKEMGYVPLISVNRVRLNNVEMVLKRLVDVSLAAAALLVGLPFMLVVAAAIKFSSPGPVIFRRRVMGLHGLQFDAFKFRTMHLNGDEILEKDPEAKTELLQNQKIKNDPRITPIGRFLRKTSMDEFPQFINILLGQMSFVGPRMISPPELLRYGQWGMNLLTVRPGLTGLWQVSGRSDVDYDERVRLDMMYIRNYSLWLDMQIILRTIPVVLLGKGAY